MYAIDSFDGITLSNYVDERMRHDMGGGSARGSFTRLPFFGFHDNYGDRIAVRGQQQIVYQGEVHPDATVPPGGKLANLRGKIDALRAKIGVRGKLYVRLFDTTQQRRWLWARLESVDLPSMIGNINFVPVTMRFSTVEQGWRRADIWWTQLVITANGGGVQFLDIDNPGTIRSRDVLMRITAGTNAITSLAITNPQGGDTGEFFNLLWRIDWTGSLTTSNQWKIDVGQMSALINSTNIYGVNLAFNTKTDWFGMVPGHNGIEITVGGNAAGNATLYFQFTPMYG